jgi:hypothetical protein
MNQVDEVFKQWIEAVNDAIPKPPTKEQKETAQEGFSQLGFTDVVLNDDWTFDGTKDGVRYTKMYVSEVPFAEDSNDIIVYNTEVSPKFEEM